MKIKEDYNARTNENNMVEEKLQFGTDEKDERISELKQQIKNYKEKIKQKDCAFK